LNRIAARFSRNIGWEYPIMDMSITLNPSPVWQEEFAFCQQGFHAKLQVWPASEEAQAMTVGSGRQLSMLLDSSSPLGAYSKILMEFSAWGNSLECCHVWERLDTRFELSAFQLARWEQDTSDTGCSLLPTMTVPNGGRVNPEGTSSTGKKPDGSKAQMDLRHAIKLELSPTPRMEGFDAGSHRGSPDSLHAVVKLSATPQAHDAHKGNAERVGRFGTKHGGRNLTDEVMLSATPSARDWKNGQASANTAERNSRPLNKQVLSNTPCEASGTLNPRFVEEYQGFPIDHTALKRSETLSVRSRRIHSSTRSRRSKK
jgi:hypothetical protein